MKWINSPERPYICNILNLQSLLTSGARYKILPIYYCVLLRMYGKPGMPEQPWSTWTTSFCESFHVSSLWFFKLQQFNNICIRLAINVVWIAIRCTVRCIAVYIVTEDKPGHRCLLECADKRVILQWIISECTCFIVFNQYLHEGT